MLGAVDMMPVGEINHSDSSELLQSSCCESSWFPLLEDQPLEQELSGLLNRNRNNKQRCVESRQLCGDCAAKGF